VRSIDPVARSFRRKLSNVHLFKFFVGNFLSIFLQRDLLNFPPFSQAFDQDFISKTQYI